MISAFGKRVKNFWGKNLQVAEILNIDSRSTVKYNKVLLR